MSEVAEVLGYTSSNKLQVELKKQFGVIAAFEIHLVDGTKFRLGVKDDATKDKWTFALNVALIESTKKRTAFRLKDLPLEDIRKTQFVLDFEKQATLYQETLVADRQIFYEECSDNQIQECEYLAGFLSFELQSTKLEDKLSILLKELVALSITGDEGQQVLNACVETVQQRRREVMLSSADSKSQKKRKVLELIKKKAYNDKSLKNLEELELLKAENASLRAQLQSRRVASTAPTNQDIWSEIGKLAQADPTLRVASTGVTTGAEETKAVSSEKTELDAKPAVNPAAALNALFASRKPPADDAPKAEAKPATTEAAPEVKKAEETKPSEESKESHSAGGPGRGAALANMFAGRGAGRGDAGGRGGNLMAALAGRGGGGRGGALGGIGGPPAMGAAKMAPAVPNAGKVIPCPPPLPGSAATPSVPGLPPALGKAAPAAAGLYIIVSCMNMNLNIYIWLNIRIEAKENS
jgi:hypothetical protein